MGVSKVDESLSTNNALPMMEFIYENYKGEKAKRVVVDPNLWYGESKYHEGKQWLLHAYDTDKKAFRDFAVKDILTFI